MPAPRPKETGPDALPARAELGTRVVVIGPSSAGKSTLAAAIAERIGATAVHLDQLFHMPGTEWEPRPPEDFDRLHAEAIAGATWVMDGNYSRHLPARLARATSVIWLAVPVPLCVYRYLRRCFSFEQRRTGGLPGGSERFKWHMLRHIVVVQPKNVPTMERLVSESGKPLILLRRPETIRQAYARWDLELPRQTS